MGLKLQQAFETQLDVSYGYLYICQNTPAEGDVAVCLTVDQFNYIIANKDKLIELLEAGE